MLLDCTQFRLFSQPLLTQGNLCPQSFCAIYFRNDSSSNTGQTISRIQRTNEDYESNFESFENHFYTPMHTSVGNPTITRDSGYVNPVFAGHRQSSSATGTHSVHDYDIVQLSGMPVAASVHTDSYQHISTSSSEEDYEYV